MKSWRFWDRNHYSRSNSRKKSKKAIKRGQVGENGLPPGSKKARELGFEPLEIRELMAYNIIVNTVDDAVNFGSHDEATYQDYLDGNLGTTMSLRDALEFSNNITGQDTIGFGITGTGAQNIALNSGLGTLSVTDSVIINGYSQPGSQENASGGTGTDATLNIVVSSNFTSGSTFSFEAGADNSEVRGLVFQSLGATSGVEDAAIYIDGANNLVIAGNYFGTDATGNSTITTNTHGIYIENGNDITIGGTTAADRNIFGGNFSRSNRAFVRGSDVGTGSGTYVVGNYMGIGANGTSLIAGGTTTGNIPLGIRTGSLDHGTFSNNVIGGTNEGISLYSGYNTIQGNIIGFKADGTTKASGVGGSRKAIVMSTISGSAAIHNLLGGSTEAARNVIGNYAGNLIYISGGGVSYNQISGNYIGMDVNGQGSHGAGGVGIVLPNAGTDNTIGGPSSEYGNYIGNMTSEAAIATNTKNTYIAYNTIGTNAVGGVAGNKTGIRVSGSTGTSILNNSIANNNSIGVILTGGFYQTTPVLSNISVTGNQINATVNVTASAGNSTSATVRIQLFRAVGSPAQGVEYLGEALAVTSGSNQSVTFTLLDGVTLTSTDQFVALATNTNGSTSQFSTAASVTYVPEAGVIAKAYSENQDIAFDDGDFAVGYSSTASDATFSGIRITSLPSTGTLFLDDGSETAVTPGQDLTFAQINQLRYRPASNDAGTYTFGYEVIDSFGTHSAASTVTLVEWTPPDSSSALVANTFLVTNTSDDENTVGSLRWAVAQANANIGYDAILFDIGASGPQIITVASTLNITDAVYLDGYTQSDAHRNTLNTTGTDAILNVIIAGTMVEGSVIEFSGGASDSYAEGLVLRSDTAIGDLDAGIFLNDVSRVVVAGNYFGTYADGYSGTVDMTINSISLSGGSDNTIGGSATWARNVFGGNQQVVSNRANIQGSATAGTGTYIIGNYFGLGANGSSDVQTSGTLDGIRTGAQSNLTIRNNNIYNLDWAMQIESSDNTIAGTTITGRSAGIVVNSSVDGVVSGNVIGGNSVADRNYIFNNSGSGILVSGTNTSANWIKGNYIGTNIAGTAASANANGIVIYSNGNTIGGVAAGEGNLISGNTGDGVKIATGFENNVIAGNTIGLNAAGNAAIANANDGIELTAASNNLIKGNYIAGNGGEGIRLQSGANQNTIVNNTIGLAANGTTAIGNTSNGIEINASSDNTIGGDGTVARNIISGNTSHNILVISGSQRNLIAGNFVGTSADGMSSVTGQVGTSADGIYVQSNTSQYNTIGGLSAEYGNVISGNARNAVTFNASNYTLIASNIVGLNAAGTAAITNNGEGILVAISSSFNTISSNIVSGNKTFGVNLRADSGNPFSDQNLVTANTIGLDINGNAVGNQVGLNIQTTNSTYADNVVAGNTSNGVRVDWGASANLIVGNKIGTDATGTLDRGNAGNGMYLAGNATAGVYDNTIGGLADGDENIIAGNALTGVLIGGANYTTGNTFLGNYIGVGSDGSSLKNDGSAAVSINANANVFGGTDPDARNYIGGSGTGDAMTVLGTGNQILNNAIGFNQFGVASAYTGDGVEIKTGTGNVVQGNDFAANGTGSIVLTSGGNNSATVSSSDLTIINAFVGGDGRLYVQYTVSTLGTYEFYADGTGSAATSLGTVTHAATGTYFASFDGATAAGLVAGGSISLTLTDSDGTSAMADSFYTLAASDNSGLIVTNTSDDVNTVGSLRWAINQANNITGHDTITFDIAASGTQTITIGSTLQITDSVTIDGYTEPGSQRKTDSLDAILTIVVTSNMTSGSLFELTAGASGSEIEGLVLQSSAATGTNDAGILLTNVTGALIAGNFFGVATSGNAAVANAVHGVVIDGGADNTIGGADAGDRNVFGGNYNTAGRSMIFATSTTSTGNVIQGNYLGIGADGSTSVLTSSDAATLTPIGIRTGSSHNGLIVGNVVAGASIGIYVTSSGNQVAGNYVGFDASGTAARGAQGTDTGNTGIMVTSSANTVGGTTASDRNVVGSYRYGIQIQGGSSTGNLISGNFVGFDKNGTGSFGGISNGIVAGGAGNYNSISGNLAGNYSDAGIASNSSRTLIENNTVGLNASGLAAGDNVGIRLSGGSNQTVSGNTIANATSYGVLITNSNTAHLVQGNSITGSSNGVRIEAGTGVSNRNVSIQGNTFSGQSSVGIYVYTANDGSISGASLDNNTITGGGTLDYGIRLSATGSEAITGTHIGNNVVTNNELHGIYLYASGSGIVSNSTVEGNTLTGNSNSGIKLETSGSSSQVVNNLIGGTTAGARNILSGNNSYGAYLIGSGTTNNSISGNYIGLLANGSKSSNAYGVWLQASGNVIGGTVAGAGNIISGNSAQALWLLNATGNVIAGNDIGLNVAGNNTIAGGGGSLIVLQNAVDNTFGGTNVESRNVVAGGNNGFNISGSTTSGNVFVGNYIGTDKSGTSAIGPGTDGFFVNTGAHDNVFDSNLIVGAGGQGIDFTGAFDNLAVNNTIGLGSDGSALGGSRGVYIQNGATGNSVQGNLISGNSSWGVLVAGSTSTSNMIYANTIGLDAAGTAAIANGGGVAISGSSYNTIGGIGAAYRNIISGNNSAGVYIYNSSSVNVVAGNYIGTNVNGDAAVANNGNAGISLDNADGNLIGGTVAGAGNLVSGNAGNGVYVYNTSSGNVLAGNTIGTNAAGTAAIGNNGVAGVMLESVADNTIGGDTSAARNLISGNNGRGIYASGSLTTGNVIAGNWIGVDGTGNAALANTSNGIYVLGVRDNTIGGTTAGARNVVSGNGSDNIYLATGTTGTLVAGNYVGTNAGGTASVTGAAGNDGVYLLGDTTTANTIGGTSAEYRNVISGNNRNGITLNASDGNLFAGNYIGTNAAGDAAVKNGTEGILVAVTAINNTFGGTVAGAGNVISGNGSDGIYVRNDGGLGSSGSVIAGNIIGLSADGTTAIANGGYGLNLASAYTTISGNVISGNSGYGIYGGTGSDYSLIVDNIVGLGADGLTDVGNSNHGIALLASYATISGNVISGNSGYGIYGGTGSDYSLIVGNIIGLSADGLTDVGNSNHGIALLASYATIGGSVAAARNIIAGNKGSNVYLSDSHNNYIAGNYLGLNINGTAAFSEGTNNHNLFLINSADNTIGGTTDGERNIISGVDGNGVVLYQTGTTGNRLIGNYIGTGPNGDETGIGNKLNGVLFAYGASDNTVGGITVSERNLISGNNSNGVHIRYDSYTDTTTSTTTRYFATGNLIVGNFIGVAEDGVTGLGNNASGIYIETGNNTVGGSTAAARNIIADNNGSGVAVNGTYATGNLIAGNYVGFGSDGITSLGNRNYNNITISGNDNTVGGPTTEWGNLVGNATYSNSNAAGIATNTSRNLFSYNTIGINAAGDPAGNNYGIRLSGGSQNTFLYNSIAYNNVGQGIDIKTFNNQQPAPVISNLSLVGDQLTITFSVESGVPARVQFFHAEGDQGILYLYEYTVSDANPVTITITVPAGFDTTDNIVATATRSNGSTSNFSAVANVPNDAPSVSGFSKIGQEDNVIPLTASDFATGYNDGNGEPMVSATITTLPANGTLEYFDGSDWVAVTAGTTYTLSQLDNLRFTPDENWSGTTSFTFTVSDGDLDSAPATATLEVSPGVDTPDLTVDPQYWLNVGGTKTLDAIHASLVDDDGSETLTVTLSGIPDGITFSTGTNLGGGVWSFTEAELASAEMIAAGITTPTYVTLDVVATSSEDGATADATASFRLFVVPEGVEDVYFVTNTSTSSGTAGSFAWAAAQANGDANYSAILFDMQSSPTNTTNNTWEIDGGILTLTEQTYVDGYSQLGAQANSLAEGSDAVLKIVYTRTATSGSTLYLNGSDDTTIRGLVLGGQNSTDNDSHGVIRISDSTGIRIEGNYINTTADGLSGANAQASGILIDSGSSDVTIGGSDVSDRNVLGGNYSASSRGLIRVGGDGSAVSSVVITGNYIGVAADGTSLAVAASNLPQGIILSNSSSGTHITGNVIGGVFTGIYGSGSSNNLIEGNLIGVGADGTTAVAGQGTDNTGIWFNNSSTGNTIGGVTDAARNVIGNYDRGISFTNSASANLVIGNYIGFDASGTATAAIADYGIYLNNAGNNTIGGGTAGTGNVIGNANAGIAMNSSHGNVVAGNILGLDKDGLNDHGFTDTAIISSLSDSNTIGGTTAAWGNLIANAADAGIATNGSNTLIQFNSIGMDVNGDAAGNNEGVRISGGEGNSVLSNSIRYNSIGINRWAGTNNDQAVPVISATDYANGMLSLTFSVANGDEPLTVQFFRADNGQGYELIYTWVSPTGYTAGDEITIEFSAPSVVVGDTIVGIATRSNGSSSEFSAPAGAEFSPTITGIDSTDQTLLDNETANPFSSVVVGDPADSQITATVTLSAAANGTLSGGGFVSSGSGVYTFTGTAAEVTAALNALVFTPTEHQVEAGSTISTVLTLTVTATNGLSVSDDQTTMEVTASNTAPTLSGLPSGNISYSVGDGWKQLAQGNTVYVSDPDYQAFDGGYLSVRYMQESSFSEYLIIKQGGSITLLGDYVLHNGMLIGTILSNGSFGSDLVIQLTADATSSSVADLIMSIGYFNSATSIPQAAVHSLQIRLTDGAGGAFTAAEANQVVSIQLNQFVPPGDGFNIPDYSGPLPDIDRGIGANNGLRIGAEPGFGGGGGVNNIASTSLRSTVGSGSNDPFVILGTSPRTGFDDRTRYFTGDSSLYNEAVSAASKILPQDKGFFDSRSMGGDENLSRQEITDRINRTVADGLLAGDSDEEILESIRSMMSNLKKYRGANFDLDYDALGDFIARARRAASSLEAEQENEGKTQKDENESEEPATSPTSSEESTQPTSDDSSYLPSRWLHEDSSEVALDRIFSQSQPEDLLVVARAEFHDMANDSLQSQHVVRGTSPGADSGAEEVPPVANASVAAGAVILAGHLVTRKDEGKPNRPSNRLVESIRKLLRLS